MKTIYALAVITFKEGIRNRALFGVAFLALFLFGLNITVAGFFMRDIGKVTVDMNLSAISFAGLLLVFFVGVNLMGKDIDRKTIQLVLSKPLSRGQYVWGKYLGILFFVSVSLLLLLAFSTSTVLLVKLLYANYFIGFSFWLFWVAGFFVLLKLWVLSAIMIFFSSLTSNSLLALIFTLSSYVVGVSIEEVVYYLQTELAGQERMISDSLVSFVHVVSYFLPNLAVFDFTVEAAHGLPLSLERLILSFGYGVVYAVILLLLASFVFTRREFN
ncbi:ABC-2 family transporter protein [Malonomonas rubra DSM 5091]|uniref:ABC-2 family transporter protein n=1 Tax=Malonomonas rubra DSM 5091 TaxID=1122189 RepID=A0A1M6D7P8_MALRU|nr:ABC transporter permease [Malonomonas rubra]SHI69219.1 ABC-2 family transporter protein [Malonomonas rubra DSM 5091]